MPVLKFAHPGSGQRGDRRRTASPGKDLLRLADLSPDDLWQLCQLTSDFASDPDIHRGSIDRATVLCWFTSPAPSISQAVAAAVARLGGAVLEVNTDELAASRVGTLENAGRVLSQLGRALIVGGLDDASLASVAEAATVPVVNAFSDEHDPCQALADVTAIEGRFGSVRHAKVAYLGAPCNVLVDLVEAGTLAGMSLVVAAPDSAEAARLEAIEGAQAIVVGPLAGHHRRSAHTALTAEILGSAHPDVILLGCQPEGLPHRDPETVVLPLSSVQLESRVWVFQSVLYALTQTLLHGR